MKKQIFFLSILLVGMLLPAFSAQAFRLVPTFTLNIVENTVGGHDTFPFVVSNGFDPDKNVLITTVNGTGSVSVSGTAFNNFSFFVSQTLPSGWGNPAVNCVSDDPTVIWTFDSISGLIIKERAFSSATCTFTNIKIPTKTPVLFIPGVMGTEISDGSNDKLWLDIGHNAIDFGDQFMDPLQFNSDLKPSDGSLVLGEVLGKPNFKFDYSDGLVKEFQNQGYTEGTASTDNLFMFPYDWRYGVTGKDASGKTSVDYLKQKIADIMTQTGATKVDVIAHSTGGLIVKKYVMDNPTDNHLGKSVFVGVPNTGAPNAIKVLLQGDSFGNPFLADSEMKKIAENLPVVYDLTPSRQYYDAKGSYVQIVKQGLLSSTTKDLSYDEATDFLLTDHSLNVTALANSAMLHTPDFDNFDMRTAGVDVYAIDGCKAGTIGKVVEVHSKSLFGSTSTWYASPTMTPGDGTVPLESATNLPIDSANKYYALKADHGKMPSQDGIREQIVNLISGSALSIPADEMTQDISECKLKGKAISIFSPLNIDITDQSGNHLGLASDGVSIENNIPNASFNIMGEHKFVYLPDDGTQTYTISVTGTGAGTFTLKVQDIDNSAVTGEEDFINIPVTTALRGMLSFGTTATLALDTDGDGTTDETLTPSTTLTVGQLSDLTPPTSVASVASDATVTIMATDENAGIFKTHYSTDAGTTWMTYTSPFQAGGETVQFYSTDNAGNNEEVQSIDVPGVVVPVIVTQTVAETPQVSSRGGGGAIILIPAILQTQAMQIEDETQAMSPQSEPADNKLVATVISPLLKTALASSEPVEDVSVVTENDAVSSTALTATAESSGSNTKPLIVLGSIGGLCLLAFFAKKLFV